MRRTVVMVAMPAAVDVLGLRLVYGTVNMVALMSRQRMQSAASEERQAPLKQDDRNDDKTLHGNFHVRWQVYEQSCPRRP